ncbi:MAG TPA: (Fe-S)-binding protein [Dehalococcoidales bacterium]|nr:(Fe-S)-binding protein [Dehalococcoidales bacterium]
MALSDYRQDMETCCRCSACKFIPFENVKGYDNVNVCPSIARHNFHAYSGGGKLALGVALLEKEINFSDKLLEVIYNCQMCGACDVSCKYAMDMDVLEPLEAIRRECVENGHTLPVLNKLIERLHKTGSGAPVNGRKTAWFDNLQIKDAARQNSAVLFHAGCRTAGNPRLWKIAQSAVKLLQNAGIEVGIAGYAESCCGSRAFQMGYQSDFLKMAEIKMQYLKDCGATTLVTACAECYYAFKVLYDRFKLKGGLEVLHTSQYLGRLVQEGKIVPRKAVKMNVTYHDPCHLGRKGEPYIHWAGKQIPGHIRLFDPPREFRRGTLGVYDPPRVLLNSIPGLKLTEMARIKEYAWCCGGGGGVLESNTKFATWTASERVREAAASGASVLVTACPGCNSLLEGTVKSEGIDLQPMDLVEVLAESVL